MSRGNSSSSSAMGQKSVDELIVEYKKMIERGRTLAPLASENLAHWLGNTGTTRHIVADAFKQESNVVAHLRNKHRRVFLSQHDAAKGILPRIKKNPNNATYSMAWEDSMYAGALTELYFALGGFTLRSKVDVSVVKKDATTFEVTFDSWQAQAYDNYNWDHGKSVYIPGWGRIDDKDALRVEAAGKAKSFEIESNWWRVTQPGVLNAAEVRI